MKIIYEREFLSHMIWMVFIHLRLSHLGIHGVSRGRYYLGMKISIKVIGFYENINKIW